MNTNNIYRHDCSYFILINKRKYEFLEYLSHKEFSNLIQEIHYQTKNDARRWVIYPDDAEASKVSPDWHGWLHRTFDEPPTKSPLPHKAWEKPHEKNQTGTQLAYAPTGSIRHHSSADNSDYEAWQPE